MGAREVAPGGLVTPSGLSAAEQAEKPGPYTKQSRLASWDLAKGWFCPGWFWLLPADLGE